MGGKVGNTGADLEERIQARLVVEEFSVPSNKPGIDKRNFSL
jgi:hypothetical protein